MLSVQHMRGILLGNHKGKTLINGHSFYIRRSRVGTLTGPTLKVLRRIPLNVRAIIAKIKLPKKIVIAVGNILNTVRKKLSIL